ncbi:MAG: Glu-tRNA(Gln) amidotransferase subunit GatE [Candidatus Hodarchaeales archaeon]
MAENVHDYKELGFNAGIEIHAQLSTEKKLFCHCSSELTNAEPQSIIQRKFRPVLGEMGVYDPALFIEFKKDYTIFYEIFNSICTYEIDETPPFPINDKALYYGIKLAKMMNCEIVEETNICRKNYLDGSVPCGFQRTALVGYNGSISLKTGSSEDGRKKLQISWIYIEEDAARKNNDRTEGRNVFFKLDRLGIPLVEIVTHHNLNSPTEVISAARTLGMLIKSSGIARRGLGALRQDINVSITDGNRVELKGIQLLQLIPVAIDCEIQRQKALVEIQKELQKRKIRQTDIPFKILDISDHFTGTSSKFILSALKRKDKIFMLPVIGFEGLFGRELQPNKRFGTELSDRVKSFTNLKGIIHSDEDLTKYNFSKSEILGISKEAKSQRSAFIIVVGEESEAKNALTFVHERVISAIKGVPQETRRVNSEGISTFTRDLHGRSRLYPDTDLPPIVIDQKRVKVITENLPENFWDQIKRISQKYSISEKIAEELVYEGKVNVFEQLMRNKSPKKILLTTLTQTLTAISRKGVDLENITDFHIKEIFKALQMKKFAKEAIPDILTILGREPNRNLPEILNELGEGMSQVELDLLIVKILSKSNSLVKERGMDAFSPLMGLIMKEARGKIDGKIVSETLRKFLKENASQ